MKLSMGYPDRNSEIEMMKERHHGNPLDEVEAAVDVPEFLSMIKDAEQIYVDDLIYEYISELIEQTRTHELIQLGISPRGALAICRTAKACALLHGRDYVVPDDVQEIFLCVGVHRIVLSPKARLHEQTAENLLKEIMDRVKRPDVKESSIR